MKTIFAVALLALVAFAACVEAGKGGERKVYASSKTFVTTEEGLHRFCIPIGKYSAELPEELSLQTPRGGNGLVVKLDSAPLKSFSNAVTGDKRYHNTCSLSLIHNYKAVEDFTYATSEIVKAGALSGYIVGEKPKWISLRLSAKHLQNIEGSEDVCKSVLGVKSESAFGEDRKHSARFGYIMLAVHITANLLFLACAIALIRCLVKRCCCKAKVPQDTVEMGPVSADQEAQDIAVAIERSLADEQKVVEVPQTATPQSIFVPPQFMPNGPSAPGATPYVPMFAPQFMHYSLAQEAPKE